MDKRLSQGMLIAWGSLLLVAMHYLQPNAGGDGLYIANNSLSWIAIALICGCGGTIVLATEKIRWHPMLTLMAVTFLLMALPYLWSPQPWADESTGRIFALAGWFVLAAAIVQCAFKKMQVQLLWILTFAIFAQALFGTYQFFFPEQFIGINNHRPAGSFMQTNVYGSLIATGMAVATWIYHQQQNRFLANLLLVMVLLCAALNLLVLSRTGMIGSFISVVAMLILLRSRRTAFSIGVASVFGICLGLMLQTSLEGAGRDNLSSPGYRSTLYSQSWQLIQEKPLLGHGFGTFQSVYTEKLANQYQQDPDTVMLTQAASHPHNELLFWWIEGGLIPVLAIVVFALVFSWRAWKQGSLYNRAMWIACIPISLHCMTEYPLHHSTAHLAILTLLMVAAWPQQRFTERPWATKLVILPKFLILLGVTLTIIAMATNLHTMKQIQRYVQDNDHKHLQQIINPHFQPRVLNMLLGRSLLSSGDPKAIRITKQFAQHEALVRPSFGSLLLLYNAALADNDKELTEQTVAQMRYLFPTVEKNKNITDTSSAATTAPEPDSLPASTAH